jgi:hypothetical protein
MKSLEGRVISFIGVSMLYTLKNKSGLYVHRSSRLTSKYTCLYYTKDIYMSRQFEKETTAKTCQTIVNKSIKRDIENPAGSKTHNYESPNYNTIYLEDVKIVKLELREVSS